MNALPADCRDANPFATCYTRPDALAWSSAGAARVLTRLGDVGGRGVVVGPHGVGKSTLLHAVAQLAERSGQPLRVIDDRLRVAVPPSRAAWVLASTHRTGLLGRGGPWWRGGSPVVVALRPSRRRMGRLFDRLVGNRRTPVTCEDALRAFERRDGNYRETWFDLYDLHEQRVASRQRTEAASFA